MSNPFHASGLFLHPVKIPPVTWNGLKIRKLNHELEEVYCRQPKLILYKNRTQIVFSGVIPPRLPRFVLILSIKFESTKIRLYTRAAEFVYAAYSCTLNYSYVSLMYIEQLLCMLFWNLLYMLYVCWTKAVQPLCLQ